MARHCSSKKYPASYYTKAGKLRKGCKARAKRAAYRKAHPEMSKKRKSAKGKKRVTKGKKRCPVRALGSGKEGCRAKGLRAGRLSARTLFGQPTRCCGRKKLLACKYPRRTTKGKKKGLCQPKCAKGRLASGACRVRRVARK